MQFRINNVFIFTILLFCKTINLFAQEDYVFTQIGTENTLSDNRVRFLLQLNDGRMAVFTEGTLNLYDGSSFKYIHLENNHIYPLPGYQKFLMAYKDDNYIWFKTSGWLALVDIKQECCVKNIRDVFSSMGIDENVSDFFIDKEFNYWIKTVSDRLFLKMHGVAKAELVLNNVSGIGTVKEELYNLAKIGNKLYLIYRKGLVACYDIKTGRHIFSVSTLTNEQKIYNNNLNIEYSDRYIYSVRNQGGGIGILVVFDIITKKTVELLRTNYWLNFPSFDKAGNLLVSSREGLWILEKKTGKKKFISMFRIARNPEIKNEITCQCYDSQGGLWLGTFNRGLLYYHPEQFKFKNFSKSGLKSGEFNFDVNCFVETAENKFIIGTSRGIYTFDLLLNKLKLFPGFPKDVLCHDIIKDSKGRIFICTAWCGIYCIENNKISKKYLPLINANRILELGNDKYLLATYSGLKILTFDGKIEDFSSEYTDNKNIIHLIRLKDDKFIGSSDSGLFIIGYKNKSDISIPVSLKQKDIHGYNCIFKDHRGIVWIGTNDGLIVWSQSLKSIRRLFVEDGLVNNSVKSIIEDKAGKIWVTTSEGISCITIDNNEELAFSLSNYNKFDGVISDEFTSNATYIISNGTLFFGGVNGFNVMELSNPVATYSNMPKPLFSNLLLFGQKVLQGQSYNNNIILSKSLTYTDRIKLKYNQNFISIEFSALNYINPTQTYFRYRLLGVDDNWREIPGQNGKGISTYTNLQNGLYRFQIKSANNSKVWSEKYAELIIEVRPPIWKTTFAYILYIIIMILGVYFLFKYFQKRSREKSNRINQEKLNKMKFIFFTNISHEFRTPITLIITPLESLLKEVKDISIETKLRTIYKHAKDLQNLVNQLLDFRRLEIHGEKLYLTYGDIVLFIYQLEELFSRLVQEKNIKFDIKTDIDEFNFYFDREKLYRILNNLLSNAFKFTPKGGKISVYLHCPEEKDIIEIIVSDTGKGIPESELTSIFDRFYQVEGSESGSGIGLHLVKEYVELHFGQINVKSELNKGTTFYIKIPTNLKPQTKNPKVDSSLVNENDKSLNIETNGFDISGKNSTILVVEDNDDLREFLIDELSKSYDVLSATDGTSGLKIAQTRLPDLIISDVLMPSMNGWDLCRNIKSNIKTSHIPIILLTALISDEHKLEGYKAGADEYLSKPFNMEILKMRISGLLESRKERHNQFINKIEINPKEITINSLDEKLIQRALDCIERNMDNAEYSVQQFSEDMGMDRTGLYKKLQAIVGLAPSDFIRSIRMKRAAQLLLQGKLSINEVSDMVGYQTTGSFSKKFKEAFGVSPSQYSNKQNI